MQLEKTFIVTLCVHPCCNSTLRSGKIILSQEEKLLVRNKDYFAKSEDERMVLVQYKSESNAESSQENWLLVSITV